MAQRTTFLRDPQVVHACDETRPEALRSSGVVARSGKRFTKHGARPMSCGISGFEGTSKSCITYSRVIRSARLFHVDRCVDARHRVPLKPDVAWWHGSRCEFVGDAKYKRAEGGIPNADIYQALAYATSAGLPGALLIYAKGEMSPEILQITQTDKEIHIVALDLDVSPSEILAQMHEVAGLVIALRDQGRQAESLRVSA